MADRATEQQILNFQRFCTKSANRENRSVQSQRGNNSIDAGAVGQPGIDHRRDFIDAAPNATGEPLDNPRHMLRIGKDYVGDFESSMPLNVNFLRAVHKYVADLRIVHQHFKRTEPKHLIHEFNDHAIAVGRRYLLRTLPAELRGQCTDFHGKFIMADFTDNRKVQ